MKHDIRKLFKDFEPSEKSLPENHRAEFLEKLKFKTPNATKTSKHLILKIAAVLIVGLALSYPIFDSLNKNDSEDFSAEIKAIETEYLINIEEEWQNFLAIAKDEKLVKRYKEKLQELDANYQDIIIAYKNDTNNIIVIESLIDNLQTRLQLLKNIQEHIKILHQKNEQNEDTI